MPGSKKTPTAKTARRDAGRPRGKKLDAVILRCALEELAVHGLEGLSVERIAEAAEVNKTTIYRKWATREALVAATLAHVHGDIVRVGDVDTGRLEEDFFVVGQAIAGLVSSPSGQALIRVAFAQTPQAELSQLAKAQLADPQMAAFVGRAVARGEWDLEQDPAVVFSLFVGGLLHRKMMEGADIDDAYLRQTISILIRGVRPRT